jgi:hypothetical protein
MTPDGRISLIDGIAQALGVLKERSHEETDEVYGRYPTMV